MRALLFLLAALLVGSPGAALAHKGENHKTAHLDGGGNSSNTQRHDWSPGCPPGSGHVCACDNLSLSDASQKPALSVRSTLSFLPPRVAEAVAGVEPVANPSPQFHPGLARAPPAFS
ncbi:MAG TPA: hypothetical protein VGP97_12430 [Burkholderiales bacterium]|nr:hypothetical protein [Burkholderiales bacterium]